MQSLLDHGTLSDRSSRASRRAAGSLQGVALRCSFRRQRLHDAVRNIIAGLILFALPTAVAAQSNQGLFSADGVSPGAVRQGRLGSCFFHASISSLAQTFPDVLRNAIGQTPDGGYSVKFIDGPAEMVYPEDVQFGRNHGFDNSKGDWVLVLEHGFAQRSIRQDMQRAIQQSTTIPFMLKPLALSALDHSGPLMLAYDRAIRSVVRQDGSFDKAAIESMITVQATELHVPASEAAALDGLLDKLGLYSALESSVKDNGDLFGAYRAIGQGGIPGRVIKAFLGQAGTYKVSQDAQMLSSLNALHANRVVMVAATPDAPATNPSTGDWWLAGHAYSVLQYDTETKIVRLRNPWGSHPDPDGTFQLPLAEFLQTYYSYSSSEPAAVAQ
jgi:hypothetical protein